MTKTREDLSVRRRGQSHEPIDNGVPTMKIFSAQATATLAVCAHVLLALPLLTSCFVVPPPPLVASPSVSISRRLSSPSRLSAITSSSDIKPSTVSDLSVFNADGSSVTLGSLLDTSDTTILACLSHFADFNAWEVTQQYISAVESGRITDDDDGNSNCNIVLVGIGSAESASKFANDLDIDEYKDSIELVADPTGSVTAALNCYRGWLVIDKAHADRWPATDVNPYVKLFGMIFGLGSPGTIGKVLYGYVGDKEGGTSSRKWVVDALLQGTGKGRFPKITAEAFDGVPADSGLRPFELATLRAQTGVHIVLNWGKLGPKDGDLFTRMGGTFVFQGGECVYEYFDKGILTYAPIDEALSAAM